jgi:diguanylate cyclase (GGDEF)-like protein
MSPDRRLLLFLAGALVSLVAAMTIAIGAQRDAAAEAAHRQDAATGVVSAAFELDGALRGFLLTAQPTDLRPYREEREQFASAFARAQRAIGSDAESRHRLAQAGAAMHRWQTLAALRIATVTRTGPRNVDLADGVARRDLQAEFREQMHALDRRLDQRRDAQLAHAEELATLILSGLVLLLGAAGYGLIRRGTRMRDTALAEELAFRRAQREFTDVLHAITVEREATHILERHLERSNDRSTVTVLSIDPAGRRLETTTALPPASSLAAGLQHAEPRDCIALRTGRPHASSGEEADGLLTCRICGQVPGRSDCRPLLVGGQAIGSVLVEHPAPLEPQVERVLAESVGRAAPLLSNLRAIAVAESHAATDPLTGLANRRTLDDALRRMSAQASRTMQPLAAIVLDIDWFKLINDRYGHDVGDDALAAIGEVLREGVRDSDLVSRLGGEEFVILAPDTNVEGAETLAEKLREAIALVEVPGVDEAITASFGVAAIPDDATTGEGLLRRADRALYLAKELGRNRVALGRALPD